MKKLGAYSRNAVGARASRVSRRISVCVIGMITTLCAAAAAWALPSCPVSPATISKCCVADQPGQSYALGSNLVQNKAVGCIVISGPNVIFDMNGHSITGPGSAGIGIHVLSTARNAIFLGGEAIEKFGTGFQTDAPKTFAENVLTEMDTRGLVFNGSNAFALSAGAVANLKSGIILTSSASGSFLWFPSSESNGRSGIVLNGTTGVTIYYPYSVENFGYGLWLKGSSFNSVIDGYLEGNTIAGAYLGCHAGGPSPSGCAIPPSNGNTLVSGEFSPFLYVGSCPSGSQHDQQYGIVIDKGNARNRIFEAYTDSDDVDCSPAGDTIYDGYDGNGPACAGNLWANFGTLTIENHTASAAHPFCMD